MYVWAMSDERCTIGSGWNSVFFLSSSVLYISLSVNNLKGNWILDGTPTPVYVVYLFHTHDTHYPPTVDFR